MINGVCSLWREETWKAERKNSNYWYVIKNSVTQSAMFDEDEKLLKKTFKSLVKSVHFEIARSCCILRG